MKYLSTLLCILLAQVLFAMDDAPAKPVPSFSLPDYYADPPPATEWSGAWLYRFTGPLDDRASAGALRRLTTLHNAFGRGWSIDLNAFGGFTLRKAVPVAAILLGVGKQAANEVTIWGGIGAIVAQDKPTGLAASIGLSLRFDP